MTQTTEQKRELLQKCGFPTKHLERHLSHIARIVEVEGRYFDIWKEPIDEPRMGDDLYTFIDRNQAYYWHILLKLQTEDISKLCIFWQCKTGLCRFLERDRNLKLDVQPMTETTKNALIAGYKEVMLERDKKMRTAWEKHTK